MTEVIPDQQLSVERIVRPKLTMFYGPGGGGKTVAASTYPGPQVWLDLDEGMDSIFWAIKKGICPHKIEDFRTALPKDSRRDDGTILAEGMLQALAKVNSWLEPDQIDTWKTLVIDSATTLNDLALTQGLSITGTKQDNVSRLQELQKKFPGVLAGLEPFRDFNTPKSFVYSLFEELKRVAVKEHRKWVIVIAHEHENTRPSDKIGEPPTILGYEPQMMGQQRKDIINVLDELYYVKNWKPSSSESVQPEFKAQTVQDSLRIAKSRFGCLPAKMDANFQTLKKSVEEFYGVPLI